MAVWMVRAGGRGQRESFALDRNVVVIGWHHTPDLSKFETKSEMRAMYEHLVPDKSKAYVSNHIGQLWAFARRIKKGDIVALPLKEQGAVAFGRVIGDYAFHPENPPGAQHTRPVEWIEQGVPRDRIDQDILYSLGALMTVCQIKRNNAEGRIVAILQGTTPPQPPIQRREDDENGEASDETAPPNLTDYAATQIHTHIAQKFTGHQLTDLIEAILRAQGYQLLKSDPGPDGGVDIIAGRGPLGFDPPRLCVQVKGGDSPQDIKVLRELKGVMKDFNADQGLFVSWGGFKRSVTAEARRHFFEIRLWDASDVIEAIQTFYDQFPDALKADLPLKRIWTLVQEDAE